MAIKDDIHRLAPAQKPDKRLNAASTPNAIREKTGLERQQTGTVKGEEVTAQSTDGLFTFVVRVVKS